ncbi:MAG TPA: FCSD flavin-binding domain-containing protein [Telmatospirillum sp.]|nr:FCSD flavin-binding domain-containing protein [Telmatospirillum sp.]
MTETTGHPNRRDILKQIAIGTAATILPLPALAQAGNARVVVIGGGFAGATCARALKRLSPKLTVTLVETNPTFVACPFSNMVIVGLRPLTMQQFGYESLGRGGVEIRISPAASVNPETHVVTLADGSRLSYDRLVVAPGVDLRWDGLPGYTEDAAQIMPHAWKAGEQTTLLAKQLNAMPDGGLVVISAPANPFRCPPGPYERASLIAGYLKKNKPKSKLIILDAKDAFSKQKLFENAWKELYPGLIEWVPLSGGGKVTSVDPAGMTLVTEFSSYKAAVANVIPPQRAGLIAQIAGVSDRTGWCPIDPVTFESLLQPHIHVIGDAAIAGAMPKSAFAANAQAKVCAQAIVTLLAGDQPMPPKLINTCYSLVAPDYGITVAGVYHPVGGQLVDVADAGGISPLDASRLFREQEAKYADGWFKTITADVFG